MARLLRESVADSKSDVVKDSQNNDFELKWGPWLDVMIYDGVDPENPKKWTRTKAKELIANEDYVWIQRLTHLGVPGVYEWKCTFKSGESIVFYAGKDAKLSTRISKERVNDGRITSAAFLELTALILEHIVDDYADKDYGDEERATFSCRTATVGDVPTESAEKALFAKYDYICNDVENGSTRVDTACNWLEIKTRATRDAEKLLAQQLEDEAALLAAPATYTLQEIEVALNELSIEMKSLVMTKLLA